MAVPTPPTAEPGAPEDLVRVLRAEGIRDRRVLAAFRAVPRARFGTHGVWKRESGGR
jgi:protein-L-isoaspartate O-methyltransferase